LTLSDNAVAGERLMAADSGNEQARWSGDRPENTNGCAMQPIQLPVGKAYIKVI
jgi:hypothetical protein